MEPVRIAVVGAGGFAFFAVTEFVKIPGVKLLGVFDEVEENSNRFRKIAPDISIYKNLRELCGDTTIDLVYIATPPFLHYEQSRECLLAGKHVICEKPAAIKLEHAIELKKLADDRQLLFVVNLMQRYNPLYAVVKEMVEKKLLGEFLHGFFENYASDEFLKEDHWFWDEQKSGGIFIEHGVHFFDMFSGWLGDAKVIAAQKLCRENYPRVWDKVQATVLYRDALVNFYHAFDQPKVMDRQEMRLQFEKGDITLFEWVPTSLRMTAICTKDDLEIIKGYFPGARITSMEGSSETKTSRGRFKEIKYHAKVSLDSGEALKKEFLYQQLVTSMFKDQLLWIADRTHVRKITSENAVESLRVAESAEQNALKL